MVTYTVTLTLAVIMSPPTKQGWGKNLGFKKKASRLLGF